METIQETSRVEDEGIMLTYTANRRNDDGSLREVDYPVYESLMEFQTALPEALYIYWKEAPGRYTGWLLDDDGHVSRCRRVEAFVDKRGYARTKVHFQWSCFYPSKKNHVGFLSTPKLKWSVRAVKARRFRIIVKAMAHMAIRGREPSEKEMVSFGKYLRSDQQIPEANLRRLLRTTEAQNMLAAEISNLLTEKGISTESVIEDYERIKSQAQTIGQLGVAKGIVDTYRDMLDMMPDKVTIEETTVSELTIEQLYSKTQHQKQLDSGKNDEHIRYATDKFEGEPGRSEAEQAGKADVRHNTEEEGRDQEESRGEEG